MAISVETFFLDPNYRGTLQQQIQHLVIDAILSHRYLPAERMPSSRGLAEHLGISRITVTLAYTDLVANDYLTSRGRSGYYVSETAPRPAKFELRDHSDTDDVDWSRSIGQQFSNRLSIDRPQHWREFKYPFLYGQMDRALFDHASWRQCALQALGQKDFFSVTSDHYDRDDPKLVDFIIRHILPRRGIVARPGEVLLTLGAQNALWLTAQVLLTQRRSVAMENPGYPGLREILEQTRCNMTSVDVDEHGLPPEQLSSDVDVVFTTPSHHFPTNATMPLARRKQLLERATHDDFLVVEDDYESEMSFLTPPSPALKSLDSHGRVIYIGSFSKSLFPGLRLGYMVGSEPFIRQARALRSMVLRHPPGLIQRTTAYFLGLGHFDALVNRTGKAFRRRRSVMETAFAEHGLQVAGKSAFGGSCFWMRAPEHVDAEILSNTLRSRQVVIEPGRAFFSQGTESQNYFRLAYSSIPAERIPEGVARIAAAIRELDIDHT